VYVGNNGTYLLTDSVAVEDLYDCTSCALSGRLCRLATCDKADKTWLLHRRSWPRVAEAHPYAVQLPETISAEYTTNEFFE
jgi:hypothetical protein